jgi:hypothetical protein
MMVLRKNLMLRRLAPSRLGLRQILSTGRGLEGWAHERLSLHPPVRRRFVLHRNDTR